MAPVERAVSEGRRGTLNEPRWSEVLRAAANVFAEKGYHSASLQDIASRVGMLKGSLYYYIDSKEDLLFDVMESAHRSGLASSEEPPGVERQDAVARLCAFIRRWIEGVEVLRPYNVAETDLRFLSIERQRPIVEIRRQINANARKIIVAGMAEGLFDPELDARLATNTLFLMLNGLGSYPGTALPVDELVDWYTRIFIRAFATIESLSRVAAGLSQSAGQSPVQGADEAVHQSELPTR